MVSQPLRLSLYDRIVLTTIAAALVYICLRGSAAPSEAAKAPVVTKVEIVRAPKEGLPVYVTAPVWLEGAMRPIAVKHDGALPVNGSVKLNVPDGGLPVRPEAVNGLPVFVMGGVPSPPPVVFPDSLDVNVEKVGGVRISPGSGLPINGVDGVGIEPVRVRVVSSPLGRGQE